MKKTTYGDHIRSMPDVILATLIKDAPLFKKYPPELRYKMALKYLQQTIEIKEKKE